GFNLRTLTLIVGVQRHNRVVVADQIAVGIQSNSFSVPFFVAEMSPSRNLIVPIVSCARAFVGSSRRTVFSRDSASFVRPTLASKSARTASASGIETETACIEDISSV